MKQLRTTLILLVLAALGGGYIYFNERGPVAKEGSTTLLRTDRATLAQIRLESADKSARVLTRAGDHWTVADEVKGKLGPAVPADEVATTGLLDTVALVETTGVIEGAAARLKDYGLDKPVGRLVVAGETFEFGTKPSFDPGRVYVKAGDKVALVPSTLADNASKPFNDWRDKAVLRFKTEGVTEIKLTSKSGTTALNKQNETWKLASPVQANADKVSVESLLSTLSTTQSTGWVDDKPADLAKYGLKSPLLTVQVGDQLLRIGTKTTGGYLAQNSLGECVFKIPDAIYSAVNRSIVDWRDKKVAEYSLTDASGMDITARGAVKHLQKVNEKWQEAGAKPDDKVNEAALDILSYTLSWTARAFVDRPTNDAAYGFDKPELILAVTGGTGATLTIGRSQGKIYVRTAAGAVMELLPADVDMLQPALDKLFSAAPKPVATPPTAAAPVKSKP